MTIVRRNRALSIAAVAALLCGCAEDGGPSTNPYATAGGAPPPSVGVASPVEVAPGAPSSNTYVGQKVGVLRGDYGRLNANVQQHTGQLAQIRADAGDASQKYFATTGAINAKLQTGTTPGNPLLVQQWNQAQGELEKINDDVGQMNNLASMVASDSALAAFLLDSIQAAFGVAGAVDEDHQALGQLQDDVNRSNITVDRLKSQVSDDVARQNSYVGSERRNLTALAAGIQNGEFYGTSLAAQASLTPGPAAGAARGLVSSGGLSAERRPLVTIRFNKPNVAFEQPLYDAVSQALQRRPDAMFDLVAISPARTANGQIALNSSGARRNAQNVLRSLSDMGLPSNRINLSETTSTSVAENEVQLFVR